MAASSSSVVPPLSNQLLHVHEVQRGNPVLAHIKNTKWAFSKDIVPDYATQSTCALFLSVRYHCRHPKHILRRMEEVGRNYRLRILLVLVDDDSNQEALNEIIKIAFVRSFTCIYAWSNLECARYLETLKNYESKSSASIQAKEETEFLPRMHKVLTSIRSVNKTDVTTMMDVFGNLQQICNASEQQLVMCPGLGSKKAKRILQALHEPFIKRSRTVGSSSASATTSNEENDIAKQYELPNRQQRSLVDALYVQQQQQSEYDEVAVEKSEPSGNPRESFEEDELVEAIPTDGVIDLS